MVVTLLLAVWYLIIGMRFYFHDLQNLFTRKRKLNQPELFTNLKPFTKRERWLYIKEKLEVLAILMLNLNKQVFNLSYQVKKIKDFMSNIFLSGIAI